ncbi:kelch-like protein [Pyxidicoccus parkwayensis]|uniref:Kelch-like protein n=1 Tax=Pyxidicoccus parkwayensis TaxID=2813578 RepID=A0ABX7NQ62_9BACT|nr:kelch repeat-containing protein [Pyxidicoccus parkwaysis]QSQ20996.1 kelch-like protein [Pyxidicoccus parkwaysis]
MHKRSKQQWALLCLMAVVVSSTLGCGSPPSTEELATGSGSVEFAGSIPQALAGDDVTRVTVTLTATGVPATTTTLALSNGTWSGTLYQVPAGTNRTFTAEAFNAEGALRYRGQATSVTITSGQTAVVAITLQSIDTAPPFDNTVPCIDSLVASASTVLPGGTITLKATTHDPDVNDTLAHAWTATGGGFSSTGTTTTTWTAPQTSGTYVLTLTVTDSRGASATVTVSVSVISTDGGTAGNASVSVSFNTSPTVRGITVSRSPVPVGQGTTVTVDAVDGDGDALSYQWTAACTGTWTQATASSATFTPGAVPAGEACGNCALTVAVTDAKGGRSQGTLRICVGPGTGASIPPRIILTNQSATTVAGGGNVTLRVMAEDGDGSALTFNWGASTGTVGTPTNSFTSSEVRWTAPACVPSGASPTITATVTNAKGFSASHTFSVGVLNGSDCGSGSGGVAHWDTTGSMLTLRYGPTSLVLPSGKVLISGGYNPTMLASAELYDPATGSWSAAGLMSRGRWSHTMTLLPSGKVLAIGGSTLSNGSGEIRNVDIYDPTTNTWTVGAPMSFSRAGHTATLLPSGKVLVIGGTSAESGGGRIPELYDPATNAWIPLSPAAQRAYHTTIPLPSGKLLTVGGGVGEFYDPATDTWAPATGLVGTAWERAWLQPSGKVLMSYGTSFALYDPVLYTQSNVGTLVHVRTTPSQVMLPSGKVLVTGGTQDIGVITELFDPATGTSSFSVSTPSSRTGCVAILLPSGKVLIAGGYFGSTYLNTALLYTP